MTMAREAIQLETSCQPRQNNRKKGLREEGEAQAPMPGPRTALADKGTRVLTTDVADDP